MDFISPTPNSINCTVFIVQNGINHDTSQEELITAIRTRINYDETKNTRYRQVSMNVKDAFYYAKSIDI